MEAPPVKPTHLARARATLLLGLSGLLFAAGLLLSATPALAQVVPGNGWADSYSFEGRCYIDSTFDHGIGTVLVDTPIGLQTVRQVAEKIGPGPGADGNPIYNDVQCGNGPPNDAGDEDPDQCPGRVDQGAAGCFVIGPLWDLNLAYGVMPEPILVPTVTCLAGNGRVDFNILNTTTAPAKFSVTIGALSPRVQTIAAGDWWRSPVTGRPDGRLQVTALMDGETIFDDMLTVACDDEPAVYSPEVQLINACRAGAGFVAWQFANPTSNTRGYVIEFDGVPNRSTSAAAFGATVRAVSGRPDGTYNYMIRVGSTMVAEGAVTVSCA